MRNKIVSLNDMIKLHSNMELSDPYIRYLCGLSNEQPYRHQEILDIYALLKHITVAETKLDGFIYGYTVPQLNKEFDLLKISDSSCLNIELKSDAVSEDRIKRQLIQNLHYLKLLNKPCLLSYLYISSTNTIYSLDESKNVVTISSNKLTSAINSLDRAVPIDLDSVFLPRNILVSPLNSTARFLSEDYLLTEHQENIKKTVLGHIETNTQGQFAGITGGPGTGKTLLIYDIARELGRTRKILMVHSGILCAGHHELNRHLTNIKIISAKELRLREIRDVDIVIVDEAHRLYTESLEKVERWVKRAKTICLFSYDAGQTLSNSENRRHTAESIDTLCANHIHKLTNKIRTNKELALFITCLRDLSKYRPEYKFPNVKIIYEPDLVKAPIYARKLEAEGYTYISYTPSLYNHSLDYQVGEHNTHNVIGQEFEGVCMIMDDNWYYDGCKLTGRQHPNPDYLFEQLLYQGLTRVRSKLALIICSEEILSNILSLVNHS